MSHNINEQGWRVLAVVIVVAALAFTGGIIVGDHKAADTSIGSSGKAPAAAAQQHYEIKQYTGVGSGVLQSGTLLDLTGKDQYSEPSDIVGHIDAAGTWAMVRSNQ